MESKQIRKDSSEKSIPRFIKGSKTPIIDYDLDPPIEVEHEHKHEHKLKCTNIISLLKNMTITDKNSVSDSIILFGVIDIPSFDGPARVPRDTKDEKEIEVVVKISFASKRFYENALVVEEQIYKNIVSNLLNNNHTPHIMKYITSMDGCKLDFDILEKKIDRDLIKFLKTQKERISDDLFDKENARILIIEKSPGLVLRDFVETRDKSTTLSRDLFAILAQVIYTLICFDNVYLNHNDLHMSNIFIEDRKNSAIYSIGETSLHLKSNVMAKIYDFDKSTVYHPSVSRNLEVDVHYCRDYGQCAGIAKKMNISGFIGAFYNLLIENKENKELKEIIDFLNKILSEKYRKQILNREYKQLGYGESTPEDSDLPPSHKLFEMIIQQYKKLYPDFVGDAKGTTYKPPVARDILFQNPISSKTHPSYNRSVASISSNSFPSFKYDIGLVLSSTLYNVYIAEYKLMKYDLISIAYRLFSAYVKEKPIGFKIIVDYSIICCMMVLPFWHKLTNNEKYNMYLLISTRLTKELMIAYEDDIWNVFNGVLPIEMPVI